MIRFLASSLVVAAIGTTAPMQCGSSYDPNNRREDTAGDALYDLAQDFRKKGNEQAAKETLKYLVAHYPSNRHAAAAREELGADAPAPIEKPGEKPLKAKSGGERSGSESSPSTSGDAPAK